MSDASSRRVVLGPDDVNRVVEPESQMAEEVLGATLRPRSFDEYVGQGAVVDNLRVALEAGDAFLDAAAVGFQLRFAFAAAHSDAAALAGKVAPKAGQARQ